MQGSRRDRVGQLIQQQLSRSILERVKDPRLGFVTVTHVKMTADLRSAVVFFSVMGDEEAKQSSLEVLNRARGFLQREIGNHLELRFTPKLQFELDDSFDEGLRIDKTLEDLGEK